MRATQSFSARSENSKRKSGSSERHRVRGERGGAMSLRMNLGRETEKNGEEEVGQFRIFEIRVYTLQ